MLRLLALLALVAPAAAQTAPRTFVYDQIAGVAPNLLSLDVYVPATAGPHPVAVYVHGGGWAIGDKRAVGSKAAWFAANGYVSANYRLSPDPAALSDPARVTYPTHPRDVAHAVAYVAAHAAEWGGDSRRIGLLGHSAGAHLVALVALVALVGADGRFLAAAGRPAGTVRAVLALDGGGYDIPYWLDTYAGPSLTETYVNAFTADRAVWADPSPVTHLSPGDPPPLLVYQGDAERVDINGRFARAATAVGVPAERFDAERLSHSEINAAVGSADPAAAALNATILRFFEANVRGTATASEADPQAAGASLFPNPARGTVRLVLPDGRRASVAVFDVLGRRVARAEARGAASFSVASLSPGRYRVVVTDAETGERTVLALTVAR